MMPNISRLGGLVLLSIASLTIMVGSVIVPGLSSISQSLGIESLASWLITLPSLGVVLFGTIAAKLLSSLGLRNGLRLGLFTYGALGVAGMFLYSPWLLLVDRLLLGGSTALIMASGTGLISLYYHGHQRLAMIAKQGMSIEFGGVVFLFMGGILATMGWQYPFLLYLFAWVLLVFVEFCIPKTTTVKKTSNTPNKHRVTSALWTVYVSATMSMIVFFSAIISLPTYLSSMKMSTNEIGYFLSFVSLIAVCAAAFMPHCANRYGELGALVRAFICYGAAQIIFFLGNSIESCVIAGILLGGGFGLSIPLVNHMTVELSNEQERSHMLAYLSIAIFLGQFLSSALELIPGNSKTVYAAAAIIAVITAICLNVCSPKSKATLARR